MKKIAVLGSTGSIGVNALKIIQDNPEKYKVIALSAGKNVERLKKQIKDFQPLAVAVQKKDLAKELEEALPNEGRPAIFYGKKGFVKIATFNQIDTVISAITGAAGLLPTYTALKAGKDIALANKETMVMAGHLVMNEAETMGVTILPIDSEHSAILQSLQGHHREDVKKVILTASGGPFRALSSEEMETISPEQALKHPNWSMGPKITIDSATLMNKGLEAIEAKWLFGLRMDQISILIHPQSIIHSMVEYKDGSIIAQLGVPDMATPISYALSYPRHIKNSVPPLDFETIKVLNFEKPDTKKFKCLALAYRAAETGESMPAVLNASNEVAVDSFLKRRIKFLDIPFVIEKTMEHHRSFPIDSIESVMEADRWARNMVTKVIAKLNS